MTHSQPEGFLAVPTSGNGRGVLVLHAWWGLNDTIKNFCTRLAEHGFVAYAPDLYHGQVADTIPDAEILSQAVDANHVQTEAKVAEATLFLAEYVGQPARGVAVVAFSLGGYYALQLSNADPAHIHSVVLFYGTGGDFYGTSAEDFINSRADYLGHFAENDPYEPPSNADKLERALRQAGRPVTLYRYSGVGHWFFEPDRTDAYNAEAANLAWERTLQFLER